MGRVDDVVIGQHRAGKGNGNGRQEGYRGALQSQPVSSEIGVLSEDLSQLTEKGSMSGLPHIMDSNNENQDKAGKTYWNTTGRNREIDMRPFSPEGGIRGFGKRAWHKAF